MNHLVVFGLLAFRGRVCLQFDSLIFEGVIQVQTRE